MKSRNILLAGLLVLAAMSPSLAQVGRGGGETPVRLLPDLKIAQVSAKGNQAVVRVANVCKGNAGPAEVSLTVYYGASKKTKEAEILKKKTPPLAGLNTSIGQRSADIVFTLDSPNVKTFDGKFIYVVIDKTNAIKEASEGNNWYERGEGAAQPFPEGVNCGEEVTDIPAPSIKLTSVKSAGSGTTYAFAVSNWDKVPFEWLTGTVGTSVQCEGKYLSARMIAHVYTVKGNGTAQEAGCRSFNQHDLSNLSLTVPGLATDSAKVKLVLEDRARKTKYPSPFFDVEPFILVNGLNALGCKSFLGIPNSFLCTTDSGFKACEDMRKGGKAIKCTRAGKQQ